MPWYSANNCSYRYRTEVDLDFCNMYIAVPQLIICTFNHLVSSRSAALLQAQPVPLVKPSYDCWPKALLENQPNPESPPNIVSATTLDASSLDASTRCARALASAAVSLGSTSAIARLRPPSLQRETPWDRMSDRPRALGAKGTESAICEALVHRS